MKLSIITINYNNKYGLQKTINSVVSQTFREFEWIIIDGGSTDGSRGLIEQYADKITYWVSEPDKGIYNAMNKGIKVANGDYLLFLNSGDRFHDENVINYVINELNGIDFISGNVWCVNKDYQYIRTYKTPKIISHYYLLEFTLGHQCTFIKTKLLKQRPYSETLKIVADWEEIFYEIVFNKRTYKHMDIIISDCPVGGITDQNRKLLLEERKEIRNKFLTHKEQDIISVQYLSQKSDNNSKKKLTEIAYTAFANCYYSEKEYNQIFDILKQNQRTHGRLYHKICIWMCLHGWMRLMHALYKMLKGGSVVRR